MALDHYVSQVHLKQFYSPKLKNLMYAIRKSDLKTYTPKASAVCRIEDGSTNNYLQEERAIEEFLKSIEPKYNSSLQKLVNNEIDSECIYTLAGFVSYILTCSPAAMRLKSKPLEATVKVTAAIMEARGTLPAPPPALAGKSLSDLLDSGDIKVAIDPKYPQAIGIASILSHTSILGNCKWEILLNPYEDNPFFTSDYPVALEATGDLRILNKIVPLAPNVAVRIQPDLDFKEHDGDFSFSAFRYRIRKARRAEVVKINRLIVRCAESVVFFRDEYPWIPNFVRNNACFHIEPVTRKIPHRKGTLLWCSQEVVESINPNRR